MRTWTKEEALPVILEAYNNNKLSAQNETTKGCTYRSPNGPCVIGLLIDDKIAELWDKASNKGTSCPIRSGASIEYEARKIFGTDFGWFSELQFYHDKWINERNSASMVYGKAKLSFEMESKNAQNEFRKLIGLEPLAV